MKQFKSQRSSSSCSELEGGFRRRFYALANSCSVVNENTLDVLSEIHPEFLLNSQGRKSAMDSPNLWTFATQHKRDISGCLWPYPYA